MTALLFPRGAAVFSPCGAWTLAALYVETDGVYFGLPGVDPWDRARDARLYSGPWPVVAHSPRLYPAPLTPRVARRFRGPLRNRHAT